jgi:hypothetical protein
MEQTNMAEQQESVVNTQDPSVLPPVYICHKEVRAAQIVQIFGNLKTGKALLAFADNVDSIVVSADYMEKHKPEIGGVYVLYADGYQSYSPLESFNNGYQLKSAKQHDDAEHAAVMTAVVAYEINRAYCAALGDDSQSEWHKAPQWQINSVIAGVQFHLENPDAEASASHENWMRQKEAEGWVYGEEKNPEKKTHPCLVPFDELPESQRAKDYLFKQVIHSLLITPRPGLNGGTVL